MPGTVRQPTAGFLSLAVVSGWASSTVNLTGPVWSSSTIEYDRLTDAIKAWSSSTILPTAVSSARMVRVDHRRAELYLLRFWEGVLSSTVKVSAFSCIVSSRMTTEKVFVCSPAAKVRVSVLASKSCPRLEAVTLAWEVASPSMVATSTATCCGAGPFRLTVKSNCPLDSSSWASSIENVKSLS